jgi:hypothetical protein
MKDFCLVCCKEVEPDLWGGTCDSEECVVVHQERCNCGRIIGLIIDDDHHDASILVCSHCMEVKRHTYERIQSETNKS